MRNITNYIFPEQQDLVSNVRSALSSFVKNQTNSSYLYNNYFLKHQLLRTSFLFTRSHCLQRADSNAISLTYWNELISKVGHEEKCGSIYFVIVKLDRVCRILRHLSGGWDSDVDTASVTYPRKRTGVSISLIRQIKFRSPCTQCVNNKFQPK